MTTIDPTLFHTASFLAVFIASIVGSLHCIGMCGGLVLLAGAGSRGALVGQLWYHVGRGTGYILLGAAAGAIGGAFLREIKTLLQPTVTLSPTTYLLITLIVLLASVLLYVRFARRGMVEISRVEQSQSFRSRIASIPILLGLSTSVLPCPWLYSFVMVAATTGTAALGAKVMAAFWFGTLPALLVAGTIFEATMRTLLKKFPAISFLSLAVALLFALAAHLGHDHSAHGSHAHNPASNSHHNHSHEHH